MFLTKVFQSLLCMAVFVSIVIYFGPVITKLDKQMNNMNQSTAACGMMSVALFH